MRLNCLPKALKFWIDECSGLSVYIFMSSFYNCQHSFFGFLLDGLALGSGQMGGNEYIQSLLLLEKGMKSLKIAL